MVWATQCITKLQAGETRQFEIPNDLSAIRSTKESFLPNLRCHRVSSILRYCSFASVRVPRLLFKRQNELNRIVERRPTKIGIRWQYDPSIVGEILHPFGRKVFVLIRFCRLAKSVRDIELSQRRSWFKRFPINLRFASESNNKIENRSVS